MKSAIRTSAVITSIRSKQDGSLGMSVSTPELSSEDKIAFLELQGINIDLFLKPKDYAVKDIREVKSEVESKTPSQRLRAVLWVYYEQLGKPGDFVDFYRDKMESLINLIKDKLD